MRPDFAAKNKSILYAQMEERYKKRKQEDQACAKKMSKLDDHAWHAAAMDAIEAEFHGDFEVCATAPGPVRRRDDRPQNLPSQIPINGTALLDGGGRGARPIDAFQPPGLTAA